MNTLRFCLNDRWVEERAISPTTTLLRYLRDEVGLSGTKEGCAEGDCGACTVAVVEPGVDGHATYRAVNACLLLLPMIQGKRVYTVEALKERGEYHLVQNALAEKLGSQCGYCTPGVVMAMFEACYRHDLDEPWKLDAQMCGNLCRCTGYRPIRDATAAIAGARPKDRFAAVLDEKPVRQMGLRYEGNEQRYFTPASFEELWDVLDAFPSGRIVSGGTDLSLEVTKRFQTPPILISVEGISELSRPKEAEGVLSLGSAVTLTDLEDWSKGRHAPLERMLRYFGARAIKNRATVGGNVCNASPIGDLPPVFLAFGATAVLASRAGERRVPFDEFFTGYRKTALREKEIFARVELPKLPASARAGAYKVSKRRELDISAVSAAFLVETDERDVVKSARLAYGGMAATPARAKGAEAALVGKAWTAETVASAAAKIATDFSPMSDHRGSAPYRSLVAKNLLIGFFEETKSERVRRLPHPHTATVLTPEVG